MSFEIVTSDKFDKLIKRLSRRYRSIPQDFASFLAELRTNPKAGDPLGRDCYKVRMAIAAKNKGKSGGARVITCVKVVGETVFLLTIHDKSEQESIGDAERDALLRENGLL